MWDMLDNTSAANRSTSAGGNTSVSTQALALVGHVGHSCPVKRQPGPGRGSIETIFWLIDCSLVTGRQMELPNLTTLLLLTLTALMQCTVTHTVAVLSQEFYNPTQHSLELYRRPLRL